MNTPIKRIKLEALRLTFDSVEEVRHLPETWGVDDYRRLLVVLDVDTDVSDADLPDYALMALQDHEPEEAMEIVLTHFSDNLFTRGQTRQLTEKLKEELAWEEYAELDHQRALYVCVDLLHAAFPYTYPEPAACKIELTMCAKGLGQAHATRSLDAATVLRAIGRCRADQRCVLNRFFPDQIGGAAFPEAAFVVWHLDATVIEHDTLAVTLFGPLYWFRGIEEGDSGSCSLTWPSAP